MSSIGHQLLNVPFPDMVYGLANAIAQAQVKLDQSSIDILKIMGDKKKAPVYMPSLQVINDKIEETELETSMIGAGFQPTFYQFAETIIEVKMAITISQEKVEEGKMKGNRTSIQLSNRNGLRVTSTPIDATYSNKYNYTQEGSSLIRTRLVPIPPNTVIQRQIDLKAQYIQSMFEAEIAKAEAKVQDVEQTM